MNYSKVGAHNAEYFDDPEDTDQLLWASGMMTVPALRPTGDWRQDIRSYLANRSPQSGEKLRPRGQEVQGMMFSLTLPKCLSVIELLDLDQRTPPVITRAANACLDLIEFLAAPLDQEPDSQHPTSVVAYAAMQRLTDGDQPMPHRHAHLVVLSLAWNDHPRFSRVTSANLEAVSHAGDLLQSMFQHRVAQGLRQLGYGTEVAGESFTIKGFPKAIMSWYCAGKRGHSARRYELLPAGTFGASQKRWLERLTDDELKTLRELRNQGMFRRTGPTFPMSMRTAAQAALRNNFFMPAEEIVVQALHHSIGSPTPAPVRLAGWMTGQLLDGVEAVKFSVRGHWCWGSAAGLAEEQAFLDQIRALPLAQSGWIGADRVDTWWGKMLADDRHRVAVLKVDLNTNEIELLKAELDRSVLFVQDVEAWSPRRNANLLAAHLRDGRLLFLAAVDAPRQSVWLKELPGATGVPVIWQQMPQRFDSLPTRGLDIAFSSGKAVEVFAGQHAQKKSAYLLVSDAVVGEMNLEIRRLRAAKAKRGHDEKVKRLAFVQDVLHPGAVVQLDRNSCGLRSTEVLEVLEVGVVHFRAKRPCGLHADVPMDVRGYRAYRSIQMELARGDRIRLTRNNGGNVGASGLRAGRRFIVNAVAADGRAYLSGGRVLPKNAGHWEYDYCLSPSRGTLKAGLVVCDAKDVDLLLTCSCLRPGIKAVVCAPAKAQAEQALSLVLSQLPVVQCRATTEEISLGLATATFGFHPVAGTRSVQGNGPSGNAPSAEKSTGMEI